jgi:hypothetical protein
MVISAIKGEQIRLTAVVHVGVGDLRDPRPVLVIKAEREAKRGARPHSNVISLVGF